MFLGQVQQPARPAEGRRYRGTERDLHRLCADQHRRAEARRRRRGQRRVVPDARRGRGDAAGAAERVHPDQQRNPDRFLKRACEVIRTGLGQPSMFNSDVIIKEMLHDGKTMVDARCGGPSGCVEISAFGKESCTLTGYCNWPKILELAYNDGRDPRTGADRPADGRPRRVRFVRAVVRGLQAAIEVLHRREDRRQ